MHEYKNSIPNKKQHYYVLVCLSSISDYFSFYYLENSPVRVFSPRSKLKGTFQETLKKRVMSRLSDWLSLLARNKTQIRKKCTILRKIASRIRPLFH